jgi:chemotaxis protein methyltransferase CheR
MSDLRLSPALFAILSGLVEERTGIHYGERDRELFLGKVTTRALEAGFESPLDYYYYLRYDDDDGREFAALIETLVVGETYFFRELAQLRVVCDEILLPAIRAGRRPRVWCAAAASGEEPFTLAMLLADRGVLGGVEIVASDISLRALSRAREGVYGARSFRSTDPAVKARCFEPAGAQAALRRDLHAAVSFHRINLLDLSAVRALGLFDVILCRNVLIYFSDDTVQRIASSLAGSLEERGVLLVGTSESLLRFGTLLTCEERSGAFFYRKALT